MSLTEDERSEYDKVEKWIAGALRMLLVLEGENQMLFEASTHLDVEARTKLAAAIIYPSSRCDMLQSLQTIVEQSLDVDNDDAWDWVDSEDEIAGVKKFRDFLMDCVRQLDGRIDSVEDIDE